MEETQIDAEVNATISPGAISKYTPLDLRDHAELIATFHPSIQNGEITLYPWQVEEAMFLAQDIFTKQEPLRHILCACNGSGKDAYVIAPFAVWHALCKIRSRCVITSSSYTQLSSQTENYIKSLCSIINEKLGQKVFVIKQMHIACTWTGSEIKLFSTDEPGRAEGYHPFPDYPRGELAIIINEGKTVSDTIFEALERCTFNRWIIVSSPGKTNGRMFNDYSNSRSVTYPEPFERGRLYSRKVTAFECPHISASRIEQEKLQYGEHHPWFRSARLAEFTSLDEPVVITAESVKKCIHFAQTHIVFNKRAGLDLSGGGDECCFLPLDGNKISGVEAFKIHDKVVDTCISLFDKYGFKKDEAGLIFADHGGVGAAYRQHFAEKGWNLSWITNQSRALNPTGLYGNRGAELWFNMRRIIEECLLLGINDQRLISQLTSRYYTQQKLNSKIILESKKEARAKGHGSPDRADALALALVGITADDLRDLINESAGKVVKKPAVNKGLPTTQEAMNISDEMIAKAQSQWDMGNKFGDNRGILNNRVRQSTLTTAQLLSYIR